jgi:hypothetical protein
MLQRAVKLLPARDRLEARQQEAIAHGADHGMVMTAVAAKNNRYLAFPRQLLPPALPRWRVQAPS